MLDVPENFLGQQVRCATCSKVFEAKAQEAVPLRAGDELAAPGGPSDLPQATDDDADREERRSRRWRNDAADEDDFDDDRFDRRGRRLRRDLEPHRGTTLIVMGIFSLVLPFVCGLIGAPIGIGLGIAAAVMGTRDLAKIRGGTMDPDGESQTRTGLVLGYVGLCLSGLVFLASCAYMVLFLGISLSQQK
jgi:hypothetical protein